MPGWPPELGGRNATPVQQLVYFEEMAKIPVMRSCNIQGLTIIAPSIRDYGSPEQQERYVLPTLRAEISWCLGMSEPGAGSDLAALSTRAELRDDHFLLKPQRIETMCKGINDNNLDISWGCEGRVDSKCMQVFPAMNRWTIHIEAACLQPQTNSIRTRF